MVLRMKRTRVLLIVAAAALGLSAVALATGGGPTSRLPAAKPMRNVLVYARPHDGEILAASPTGAHGRFLAVGDNPSVSPDGRYVAYVRGENVLVVPTAGGRPTIVATADGATWAPNSQFLALSEYASQVVVEIRTSKVLTRVPAEEWFAFSPDSKRIAYIDSRDLYVAPTTGGAPVRLTDDHNSLAVAWGTPGIAFFRYANKRGPEGDIWLTDGRKHHAHPLTHLGGHFGPNMPVEFSANGRELLAAGGYVHGSSVWAVDLPTGDARELSALGYAWPLGLSTDGKTVLVGAAMSYIAHCSGVETIPFAGGKPRIVARGSCSGSWNAR